MISIDKALPQETARVRRLIVQYNNPILNGAGQLAALLMEQALQEADKAMISGDLASMIIAYEKLKDFTD